MLYYGLFVRVFDDLVVLRFGVPYLCRAGCLQQRCPQIQSPPLRLLPSSKASNRKANNIVEFRLINSVANNNF
jgi:hypothetical protein